MIKNKLNDYEMNRLNFSEALKYDRRKYFQYYWSLLKTGHIVLFAFVPNNDYNSMSIKMCLFISSLALYFTINALFFNNETMHRIFDDHGKYNIIYQLPQIIYSSLISTVISIIMKYLSLSQQEILNLKTFIKSDSLKKSVKELKKRLLIKFILFYLLSYALIIFYWIYVSSFCAVYKNTQKILIVDTIISFGISLTYPFGYYLIPGIFRIPALKSKNKKKECIYKISLFIQLV